MKRVLSILLCLLFLCSAGLAEDYPRGNGFNGKTVHIVTYDSESLYYSIGKFGFEGVTCYLTEIWMQDPGRQIGKVSSAWKKEIMLPVAMMREVPEAALAINGSGYVSPVYPWIPENYPGTNADYYYTPLGSLTVTDGEVYRNLEGVLFNGLTLQADGLHMWVNADNEEVMAGEPQQTWSFYDQCPMIRDHEDILPQEWTFADRKAMRTVIACINRNNYVLLTVSNSGRSGLTLREVNQWLLEHFEHLEWAYDLDGGPSSALIYRRKDKKILHELWGGKAKDMDIMFFKELP